MARELPGGKFEKLDKVPDASSARRVNIRARTGQRRITGRLGSSTKQRSVMPIDEGTGQG
ncbi:hypothetical protein K469DRAFT_706905, partial [Zopfia rhizophila CBS 207.26]